MLSSESLLICLLSNLKAYPTLRFFSLTIDLRFYSDSNYTCSLFSKKCEDYIKNAVDPVKELGSRVSPLVSTILDGIFKNVVEEFVKDWLVEKTYDVVFNSISNLVKIQKYVNN